MARVERVVAFDRVVLSSGRFIRLLGLSEPDPVVRPAGWAEAARRSLQEELADQWVHVEPEESGALALAEELEGYLWLPGGRCVNERILAAGEALLWLERPALKRRQPLLQAALEAQRAGRGWFGRPEGRRPPARPLPFHRGGVVALYYQDPALSYASRIREIREAGAERISFLFTAFVDKVDSVAIDRFGKRTVRDDRLQKCVEQAREQGLESMFLPIVLIRHASKEDWRGTLRPADLEAWFRSYLEFVAHYADLAQAWGVETFSAGSELCSLERHEALWRWVLENLRGRFAGLLTYSFNWDHAEAARFHDLLDFVGLTSYWTLTDKNDPTLDELVAAWRRVRASKEGIARRLDKPIVLTELGYPSQDGANREPWNYYLNPERVDLAEQAECLEAFARVFAEPSFLMGVYFFDWFEEGGPEDSSYSPRGKPALEVIRAYLRDGPRSWLLPGRK